MLVVLKVPRFAEFPGQRFRILPRALRHEQPVPADELLPAAPDVVLVRGPFVRQAVHPRPAGHVIRQARGKGFHIAEDKGPGFPHLVEPAAHDFAHGGADVERVRPVRVQPGPQPLRRVGVVGARVGGGAVVKHAGIGGGQSRQRAYGDAKRQQQAHGEAPALLCPHPAQRHRAAEVGRGRPVRVDVALRCEEHVEAEGQQECQEDEKSRAPAQRRPHKAVCRP